MKSPTVAFLSSAAAAAILFAVAAVYGPVPALAQGPSLPPGLAAPDADTPADGNSPAGPALPSGLGGGPEEAPSGGPSLPEGLGADANADADEGPESADARQKGFWPGLAEWFDLTGFAEVRAGTRLQEDPHEDRMSLGEARLHLEIQKFWEGAIFKFAGDFVWDPVLHRYDVDLHTGEGWFDLRQANVAFTPVEFMDVKVGRQILTWGTGDLLFLNDLFPKDWQSFFIGRELEYLKSPSDAIKISLFGDQAEPELPNLDVIYVPRFNGSRFISGRRLSYWNGTLGRTAGKDAIVDRDDRNTWFSNQEIHARLYRNLSGVELAAYGYWGYWKTPEGLNPVTGQAWHPRLAVYGASARGKVFEGIGNVEAAYYDSIQDRSGDDPFIRNSEVRLLAGYKQDLPFLADDLTVGGQYYVELMMDHDAYRRTAPPGTRLKDFDRHVLTLRVTKLLLNQNLTVGFFGYYSPTDEDAYLRPKVSYKIDDHWTVEGGGNVFFGNREHTFFGQFADNTNVYGALRYGF
jgi:hypothetical protein